MEYIENLPITEFRDAFETILDKDVFLRGGELKLMNSSDVKEQLVREHMMLFPEKYN